jgi:hypothetical protein
MADFHTNFAYSTIATAPSPATSGTSLVVHAGDGTLFPVTPFNATIWPIGAQPTSANAEIVRVTNITGDTFTITRTQESTGARTVVVGDQIAATITAKTLTDVETALPSVVTAISLQNRQLGASTQSAVGQNSLWLAPFKVPANTYVSMSTLMLLQSFTGTATSNQTNTFGQTIRWALFSNNTTNSTRVDSWISGSITMQVWNSGTVSASWAYEGTTSSSAATGILTQVYGLRQHKEVINSSMPPGLYVFGFALSTSTGGASSIMRTFGMVMDNPVPVAMGSIGAATNASIGIVDGGRYSATTGAIPSSLGLSEIIQSVNVIPFFKVGAI